MSLFTCYSLITFVRFLKKWPTTIPSKKYDKIGQKTANKEERTRKRERERERAIEKDQHRFINKKRQNFYEL